MMKRFFLVISVVAFSLAGACAVSPSSGEATTVKEWVEKTLLADGAREPFSLPWNGFGVYFTDSYAVRSFLLPGFGVIPPGNWGESEQTRTKVKKAYEECRRVAPLMLGDYYPLTPYSLAPDQWIAWQFYRPELGDGMVQCFRRADAKEETLTVQLHDLEPGARYEVENLDGGTGTRSGLELMEGFAITLKSTPAAVVLIYGKL